MAEITRKQLIGQVLESGMHKTTIVRVDSRGPHPVYKKYITQSKKYYIHDPQNECKPGDKVSIIECRPMSKLKRWRLKRIEKRAIEI